MTIDKEDDSNPVLVKLKKFAETTKSGQSIVFCVECGSTVVDQKSIHELYCTNCDNAVLWDGYSFGIARDGSPYDAASAFQNVVLTGDYYKDFHSQTIRAIQDFAKKAIALSFMNLDYTGQIPDAGKSDKEYETLKKDWEQCKATIDDLLSKKT